ncbi:hypothetical protein PS417_24955 [Pseudomonas simiae]|jgi:hypothetical protein|uniref:Uncharacterized protein n=1 Tax=Pseudomonas simiae TaxID=321846 RepID=A0A1N7U9K6_9PSED|nr:hypothetical protein PS417_24955 [Pseudomonas simiae]
MVLPLVEFCFDTQPKLSTHPSAILETLGVAKRSYHTLPVIGPMSESWPACGYFRSHDARQNLALDLMDLMIDPLQLFQ